MNQFSDSGMTSALLIAVVAGMVIGMPTGPARFFVVDTCLNDGKKSALMVYAGLFTALLVYASLAFIATDFISGHQKIESISYLVASALLIVWGIIIMIKSNQNKKASINLNIDSWYQKGFVVGISNPVIPFIYLTLIQLIKIYSKQPSLVSNIVYILIFEIISFLTISGITLFLLNKKDQVMDYWKKVKLAMGVLLIAGGSYSTIKQLDFSNGIKIKNNKSFLEEQVDKSQQKQQEKQEQQNQQEQQNSKDR